MKAHIFLTLAGGLAAMLLISMIVVGAAQGPATTSSPKSEGEQMYTTGKDVSRQIISFTGGPDWFKKSNEGCVACHGADGRGGRIPHSGRYAPSIQYSILESEGYTETKIGRAITKGEDASGASLSSAMPRYNLSEDQLAYLLSYMKKLGVSQTSDAATLKAEGQRIYLSGVTLSGARIPFSGGPSWFVASGGGCVPCHGRNGLGGMVHSCMRHAPNIQYAVLRAKHYTDPKIKRSITEGVNAAGTRLNNFMPRWKMSDEQLDALIVYLETLKTK